MYGTMNNNKDWHPPQKIRIYGHGTLSGDKIPHPTKDDPIVPSSDRYKYHPIDIVGAEETFIEGITIANSAFHSIMMPSSYNLDKRTEIQWVKIFTWRPNGDGINPFGIILAQFQTKLVQLIVVSVLINTRVRGEKTKASQLIPSELIHHGSY